MRQVKNIVLKMDGKIFIPGGYTTCWPKRAGSEKDKKRLPVFRGSNGLETCFIPASQIKAGWRRAAVACLVHMQEKPLLTLHDYYHAVVGGDLASKKGVKNESSKDDGGAENAENAPKVSILDFQEARQRDPVSGLFGSGNLLGRMSSWHIVVRHGMADADGQTGWFGGTRADDANREPERVAELVSWQSLDKDLAEVREINKKRAEINTQIRKAKRKIVESSGEEKQQLNQEITDKKAELLAVTNGANAVSHPLEDQFEYVIADHFDAGFTLLYASLEELGLLLHAMEWQALTNPYYGAHRSIGFGEFSAVWEGKDGFIRVSPFEPMEIHGNLFHEAKEAFIAHIQEYDLSVSGWGVDEGE